MRLPVLPPLALATALVLLAPSAYPEPARPVPGVTDPPFGAQTSWPALDMFIPVADELQTAGVAWTRFDLNWWANVEKTPGEYNFDTTIDASWGLWNSDWALEELASRGINTIGLLCYGNPLYDGGVGPSTAAGRRAFGEYAYQAALRYQGDISYWEIWNEPNLSQYWGSVPDPEDYTLLVIEAAARIREANPEAQILGGVTSLVDLPFLEDCFGDGLLEAIDILTVHPYRQAAPESWNDELDSLRSLIDQYTDLKIPVWVSEWGFNRSWFSVNEISQAKILSRTLVNNFAQGIDMTIWFSGHAYDGWGLVDDDIERMPAWTAMAVANDLMSPPIAAPGDPFEAAATPSDSQRHVAVFQKTWDHWVITLWRATWPVPQTDSPVQTALHLRGARGASVQVHDGISGAEQPVSTTTQGLDLQISGIEVPSHVVYIEVFAPAAELDWDADGLPDFWETVYSLDPESAEGDNGAEGDPDGDGISNLQEWRDKTDPQTPNEELMPATGLLGLAAAALVSLAAAGRMVCRSNA